MQEGGEEGLTDDKGDAEPFARLQLEVFDDLGTVNDHPRADRHPARNG